MQVLNSFLHIPSNVNAPLANTIIFCLPGSREGGNNVTVLWGKLVGFSFYVKYAKAKLKTLYLHFGWC